MAAATTTTTNIDADNAYNPSTKQPPKIVFIVPYRDRLPHKTFFTEYMTNVVMRDYVRDRDYAIYFAHQKDARPFNRGAMKNIGFLAIKYKYPADYKDITFVFNDIDTVPYDKDVLNYGETVHGVIKHFYGFTYALGGIFSIKGSDFERIGGFPNFWAWGCEDNCIYNRAIAAGVAVDRSTFYLIGDQRILQLYDGATRNICRTEALSTQRGTTTENLLAIRNLRFEFNAGDGSCIDVLHFNTTIEPGALTLESQNIMVNPQIDLKPAIRQQQQQQQQQRQQPQSNQAPSSILRRPFMMASYNNKK